jgi:ubiquinone/menaquinone biosynthesis C-methylase UbiE
MNPRKLWSNILGRRMTTRLMKLILPDLVWNQEIYGNIVRRYINSSTRWLDVGCGWRILGRDLEPIEDDMVANAALVVGCDLSLESMVKHRNIRKLVLASADNFPFSDGSFDLVTCNMVVEHLEHPEKCFAAMTRLLSPGGQLIIHTPNLLNYAVFLNHTLARWLPREFILRLIKMSENRGEEDIFVTYYRANTVRRLVKIGDSFGLKAEHCRLLTSPQPFFKFFSPLALVQILLKRLTMFRYFRQFASTIVIVLRYHPLTQPTKYSQPEANALSR